MSQYSSHSNNNNNNIGNSSTSNQHYNDKYSTSTSSSNPLPSSTSGSTSTSTSTYTKTAPITIERSRQIAQTHFQALQSWLHSENVLGANGSSSTTRSNARDKLTKLTRQQNQELSTDVYDELLRRLDEKKEGGRGAEQYLPIRSDFHPKRNQARQKLATLPLQRFRDLASDVYFELERRYPEFSEEELHPSRTLSPTGSNPLASSQSRSIPVQPGAPRGAGNGGSNAMDVRRRKNSANASSSSGTAGGGGIGNDIVVPNKSTLVIEEEPSSKNANYHPRPPYSEEQDAREELKQGGGGDASRASEMSSTSGGTSAAGMRFINGYGTGGGGSMSTVSENGGGNRRSWEYEEKLGKEKVIKDYEYKLTLLQAKVTDMERDQEEARENERKKTGDLEKQVRSYREKYEDQSVELDALSKRNSTLSSQLQQSLRAAPTASSSSIDQDLHAELSSLVEELRELQIRLEESERGREEERERAELEESKAREWKKKWEAVKTELRGVRATSQLFVGSFKVDSDHMPAAIDGMIADVHVTAFQVSIDDLLLAARSKEPSSVLQVVRTVMSATESILEDIRSSSINSLSSSELDRLSSLETKTTATLSNLMTACKNHAISFGLSPVSLVDAAASHLSATVVELIRLVKIKRTLGAVTNGTGARDLGRSVLPPSSSGPIGGSNSTSRPLPPIASSNGPSLNSARGITGMTSRKSSGNSEGNGSIISPGLRKTSSDYPPPPPLTSLQTNSSGMGNRGITSPIEEDRYQRKASGSGTGYNGMNAGGGSLSRNGGGERDREERYPVSNNPSTSTRDRAQLDSRSRDEEPLNKYDYSPAAPSSDSSYGGGNERDAQSRDYGRAGGQGQGTRPPQVRGSVLTYGSHRSGDSEELRVSNTPSTSILRAHLIAYVFRHHQSYLESQTEAIVHSIQSLLSAIRSGAQGEQLNENLTQIITIVSSICSSAKDSLPYAVRKEGDEILKDLQDNGDRLSEMQRSSSTMVFNKQTKQAMASASFGVAKSLKSLNALLANEVVESLN